MEGFLEGTGLKMFLAANWYNILIYLAGVLLAGKLLVARFYVVKALNLVRETYVARADGKYTATEYERIGKAFVEVVEPALEEAWQRIKGLWFNRSK